MRTLFAYMPLLLCPAIAVVCLAGPRLWKRKSTDQTALPRSGDAASPDLVTGGADPALAELGELRAEVARLRSMVTPTQGASGGAPAGPSGARGRTDRG